MPRRQRRCRGAWGQAAVELALALPLIVVVLLAVLQIGVVTRNEIAVRHAAREGARAASVSAAPGRAATIAAQASTELPISVSVAASAQTVTVTVTYVDPTDVAIIGVALGPVTHSASATMVFEPP